MSSLLTMERLFTRLAINKKRVVVDEEDFLAIAGDHFSLYYQPLISWVNRLRKVVFPDGK